MKPPNYRKMKSWENNDNYNFLSYTWLVKELQLEKMCTYLDPINPLLLNPPPIIKFTKQKPKTP